MKRLTLLGALALPVPVFATGEADSIEVWEEGGERYCTVHAGNVPADELLIALTTELGRDLHWND